jgi:hypothetical protein
MAIVHVDSGAERAETFGAVIAPLVLLIQSLLLLPSKSSPRQGSPLMVGLSSRMPPWIPSPEGIEYVVKRVTTPSMQKVLPPLCLTVFGEYSKPIGSHSSCASTLICIYRCKVVLLVVTWWWWLGGDGLDSGLDDGGLDDGLDGILDSGLDGDLDGDLDGGLDGLDSLGAPYKQTAHIAHRVKVLSLVRLSAGSIVLSIALPTRCCLGRSLALILYSTERRSNLILGGRSPAFSFEGAIGAVRNTPGIQKQYLLMEG